MSFKEVNELRKNGRIDEAYALAVQNLQANPESIWNKRALAWVLYEKLKTNTSQENFGNFSDKLNELIRLSIPEDEKMVFENVTWQIIKMVFNIYSIEPADISKVDQLFDYVKQIPISKPSEVYSILFKAFHKGHLNWTKYIEFADWWNFENFRPEDYLMEELKNGQRIMSIVEQAYIAYSRRLLLIPPTINEFQDNLFYDREKVTIFIKKLDDIIVHHPEMQYPPYYKAKLLLTLGEENNVLSAFLPFARMKTNEFWVWDLIAEIFKNDEERRIACLCRALSCKTPPDFLIKVRLKLTEYFVEKKLFPEAKTEILEITKIRNIHGWKIPGNVNEWMSSQWFLENNEKDNNADFYQKHFLIAEELMFHDVPEELAVVEFVNRDRKILNFIINRQKYGFIKYEKYLKKVEVGDCLLVRLENPEPEKPHKVLTLKPTDQKPGEDLLKYFEGTFKKRIDQDFGFVESIFIDPENIKKNKLTDGLMLKGQAIISFNRKRNDWGWKLLKFI